MDLKKQQQLKKLEKIAQKYSEKKEKHEENKKRERSLIPIPRKNTDKNALEQDDNLETATNTKLPSKEIKECVPIDNVVKNELKLDKCQNLYVDKSLKNMNKDSKPRVVGIQKNNLSNLLKEASSPVREIIKEPSRKEQKMKSKHKEARKIIKESTMSLDSLEESQQDSARNCHSIGINTELLCVPCVIHDNAEQKLSARMTKKYYKTSSDTIEPKIELLYKNPVIVSSCETQCREPFDSGDSKENVSIFDSSTYTASNSSNFVMDNIDPTVKYDESDNVLNSFLTNTFVNKVLNNDKIENKTTKDLKSEDDNEIFDENYERDVSNDKILNCSVEHKSDAEHSHRIECRFGSGETYTKFTENQADLDEFINLTDKMIVNHNFDGELFEIDKDINGMHTPKTNSLDSINKSDMTNEESPQSKVKFSDTFAELKNNFKKLLDTAGGGIKEALNESNFPDKSIIEDVDNTVKVCDMEHITVYGLKLYEQKTIVDTKATSDTQDSPKDFKLPSIAENNKPERKSVCNKKRMQRIYKPNRKYKMLADQKRSTKDNQTFIVNSDDNSDNQSVSSEAPPFKLPRIEINATRLEYIIPSYGHAHNPYSFSAVAFMLE